MLTITLLGTAATMPLPDRALSTAFAACGGHGLLFDCGEGTQAAARRAGVNLMRADAVCLTHYHGDHIFGLPGLLQTLGAQGRTRPLLLVGPIAHVGEPEKILLERIREEKLPCILCINKIDTVEKKDDLLAVIAAYSAVYPDFDAIIPISARTGDGLDELMAQLAKYAVPGPQLFPDGMTTDQPDSLVCAEIVREKMLRCLDKEIPHGTAVEVTRFTERDNGIIDLDVTIYCEKASHKGIIIGKHGDMLKHISTLARQDIEKFMGTKVYMETWVKVKENWRDNVNFIRAHGYDEQ